MASTSLIRQLGSLFDGASAAGLSDRQLIERFHHRRDEAAFAALVARHGPMVLGVCRQLLADRHLAEDAFQATFLVLARKARSLRDPDRLATWLYGVALRTARKARARVARQRIHEQGDVMDTLTESAEPMAPPADQALLDRDQAELLHGEIDGLPGIFRSPIVLCYFEGLTLDEAARQLRCPAGTLRSRLARAREKLRRALVRRGVALSTTALAAALSPRSASASVSTHLCDVTARAALGFASRPAMTSTATTLAHEILRAITIHKLRTTVATLMVLAVLAAGGGYLARSIAMGDEPRKAPAATKPDDAAAKPAPGRMFVVGRVLDPSGKPVPHATVAAALRRKLLFAPFGSEGVFPTPIGHTASDGSGRFRLDAPCASSSQHAEFGATALAPGYGMGWADLDPDEDRPPAEITLQPEQLIEGRVDDTQGRPVPGVQVSVWSVRSPLPPRVGPQGAVRERSEGPQRWWGRINDGPGWPAPATSDADGRFTLHGIGRGLRVQLSVLDPRFAPQTIEAATDDAAVAKPLKIALQASRTVTGRVTYADTGKPAAHAKVGVDDGGSGRARVIVVETDAEGRFRASPMASAHLSLSAAPPDGQPYFGVSKGLDWLPRATEQAVDLALPRGALIRGKATEEGTGRPVADVTVHFNPYAPRLGQTEGGNITWTKADGSFAFGVGPHPGHLSIQAPAEDYQLQAISNSQFYEGQGGGRRLYAHAFIACDPTQGAGVVEVNVALRRGATVKLRLIGPDGQPVPDVWVFSRAVLNPAAVSTLRGWQMGFHDVARHGHFEVHGLDPEGEVPVYLLQPDRKLGATVRLSGKSAAGGPVTVRLEPCGMAMARLVGPDGQPLGGRLRGVSVTMAVTPGPPRGSAQVRAGALAADEAALSLVDPVNHSNGPVVDAQGRITLRSLIPGATYRIVDRTAVVARDVGDGPQVRREFVVGPGQAVELGDVGIGKPQALIK